jgi:DNA-directed RNA polymerase specialized sigma24 family protein
MKLELTPKIERTHRTVFQERYGWLLSWALKLTRGDREEAEDILHDTYIQFLRLAPPLHTIENVDAYLNRMVRNLHLSRVMRRSRVPMVALDAVDYDSASLSVEAVDPFRLLPLQRDLRNICDWGCGRRSKTRAASGVPDLLCRWMS